MKIEKKKSAYLIVLSLWILCFWTGCKREKSLILTDEISLKEELPSIEESTSEKDREQQNDMLTETIFVHIYGAVVKPGVYELPSGTRIFHAVESAGGFRKEADENYLNQAQILSDGMQLYIPTKEEVKEAEAEEKSLLPQKKDVQTKDSGLININTADTELLCTLPGIGSAKAADIIAYREENGSFLTIQDIMKVDGIKEGMFSKIKNKICV